MRTGWAFTLVALTACGAAPASPATGAAAAPNLGAALAQLSHHLAQFPITDDHDALRIHGQVQPARDAAAVARDREMFQLVARSGAFAAALEQDDRAHIMVLCLSLLATAESTGIECLSDMASGNKASGQWSEYLHDVGLPAAGQPGELLAVQFACESGDSELAALGALYLSASAAYEQTITPIEHCLDSAKLERAPRVLLTQALGKIASPLARPYIAAQLDRTDLDDAVQAKVVWSFVELNGRSGLARLEALAPKGQLTKSELASSLEFLKTETTEQSPFGLETRNDIDGYRRFADLDAPVCTWVAHNGGAELVAGRRQLTAHEKQELLAALEAGGGFGFDFVKGSLFEVVDAADVPALLRIARRGHLLGSVALDGLQHGVDIVVKQARMR